MTNDDTLFLNATYSAFLDARCRSELGYDFEDAMAYDPDEARRILAEVALHRWPHLRQEAS